MPVRFAPSPAGEGAKRTGTVYWIVGFAGKKYSSIQTVLFDKSIQITTKKNSEEKDRTYCIGKNVCLRFKYTMQVIFLQIKEKDTHICCITLQ